MFCDIKTDLTKTLCPTEEMFFQLHIPIFFSNLVFNGWGIYPSKMVDGEGKPQVSQREG
jgi:hypothetical protein